MKQSPHWKKSTWRCVNHSEPKLCCLSPFAVIYSMNSVCLGLIEFYTALPELYQPTTSVLTALLGGNFMTN